MQVYNWRELDSAEQTKLLARPQLVPDAKQRSQVADIINQVRTDGDMAIRDFTRTFDGCDFDEIRVDKSALKQALEQLPAWDRACLERAIDNIRSFHTAQLPEPLQVTTSLGLTCRKKSVPIPRVGLYIPGGTAPLVSTVLMLAVPAAIAGCPTRVVATPPNAAGEVDTRILAACALTGIDTVYRMGGAQAIAALAYGTESVTKVDKIFGPGNSWVTIAKQTVAQDPEGAALDMPAGPSEVLVLIDDQSDPRLAAADLLSQAEHGPDSQVILVSLCPHQTAAVLEQVEMQLAELPRRDIAAQALRTSRAVNVTEPATALAIIDRYAPEHLILLSQDAVALAEQVGNAGSIFIGPWTPESLGDYASGTNHVLPTNGAARAFSGLTTAAFMKTITLQECSAAGLQDIGPVVERLAEMEGLTAHQQAVRRRLNILRGANL